MQRTILMLVAMVSLTAADGPKPWEASIAALTDSRATVYESAIDRLIAFGAPALHDVAALANDADWRVRGRVVTVAAAIGGEAATVIVIAASRDNDVRVRELGTLALGKVGGAGVYERLIDLLRDRQAAVRIAAARGLVDLGDARALPILAEYATELDADVRKVRGVGIEQLASRPAVVPALVELLATTKGDILLRLVMASGRIGDPRLSPALAALLTSPDHDTATLAAQSLAANGDSRCVAALCRTAADGPRTVAAAAAATLRTLTDFNAAPGQAWTVWWTGHADEIAAVAERDAFIAALHDPAYAVTADELARFTPEQLMPLVDGMQGDGAWWWPRRATEVLLRDHAARWTAPLLARIRATEDPDARLAVIILLDQLGDPAAVEGLHALLNDLRAKQQESDGKRNFPTIMALEGAVARRRTSAAGMGGSKPAFMR